MNFVREIILTHMFLRSVVRSCVFRLYNHSNKCVSPLCLFDGVWFVHMRVLCFCCRIVLSSDNFAFSGVSSIFYILRVQGCMFLSYGWFRLHKTAERAALKDLHPRNISAGSPSAGPNLLSPVTRQWTLRYNTRFPVFRKFLEFDCLTTNQHSN